MTAFRKFARALTKPLIVAAALMPLFLGAKKAMAEDGRFTSYKQCVQRIPYFSDKDLLFVIGNEDQPPLVRILYQNEYMEGRSVYGDIYDAAHSSLMRVQGPKSNTATSSTYQGDTLTPAEALRMAHLRKCAATANYLDFAK